MKGFTKDGKFRPTEKRNKSSISKNDALKEYTHSTLTSIRQEDAINFLKRKGISQEDAVPFIQEELKEYPVARVGAGYGKPEERKDEDIDDEEFDYESALDEIPVEATFEVIDDGASDYKEKYKEKIRLPEKDFEDFDIERQVLKALKELKKRGVVPEDAQVKFDDHGFEGWQLDVYIKDDDNHAYSSELAEHKGIRMSMQVFPTISDELHDTENFDEGELEHVINDKLQEQFDNGLSGSTIG